MNRIIRWSISLRRNVVMTAFCATQGMCVSFVGTMTDAPIFIKATLMVSWASCVIVCSYCYHAYKYWHGSAQHWKHETHEWIAITDKWKSMAERNDKILELNHLLFITPPYKGDDN